MLCAMQETLSGSPRHTGLLAMFSSWGAAADFAVTVNTQQEQRVVAPTRVSPWQPREFYSAPQDTRTPSWNPLEAH